MINQPTDPVAPAYFPSPSIGCPKLASTCQLHSRQIFWYIRHKYFDEFDDRFRAI